MLCEHSRQGAPLDCSITGLPVKREYFSERHSRILLDLTVQFNEGNLYLNRQFGSQSGLAGSAKPNQRDALPAQLFSRTEVPHQPEHHIFEAMIGEAFEESLDHLFFGRLFHLRGEQLDKRNVESGGNPPQQYDRDVSFARLELRKMTFRHVRFARHQLAGHPAEVAYLANSLAKEEEEIPVGNRRRPV